MIEFAKPGNDATTNASTKNTLDADVLSKLGSMISSSAWETIKNFVAQEQELDSFRAIIHSKLSALSKQVNSDDWEKVPIIDKCKVVREIQECFYDLQLVEHANQAPLIELAKVVFSMNKRRCMRRTSSAKAKPPKKQKLEASLSNRDVRRIEREQKSPSFSRPAQYGSNPDLTASSNPLTQTNSKGEALPLASRIVQREGIKRRLNQDKCINGKSEKSVLGATPANTSMDVDDDCALNEIADCTGDMKEPEVILAKKELSPEDVPLHAPSPPRRRAAAVAAAMSVAETVNPRSHSPRKRGNGASNLGAIDDDMEESAAEVEHEPKKRKYITKKERRLREKRQEKSASPEERRGSRGGTSMAVESNEPTYCHCNQVSYGNMVCCDNTACEIEWFHFNCVGLSSKPRGKWYCDACTIELQKPKYKK
ncbi:inhibitor of growth protein 4 [Ditylenchus destructor]|uniref:Inhibitor of growth protein 4 n=1 Tax=Ditylenchus destructor TaxID=166010 RepID=A0AAD4NCB4_9BILA|nr:inhibitor of growth protein 4 [Ditylenchus destructor]